MNQRLCRCGVAAATAFFTLGAWAAEATPWDPQADAAAAGTHEAMLAPTAWAAERGDATQFRDGVARDSITARAAVRADLREARAQGLMNDTGEAGASDRVLARRAAFADAQRERQLASDTHLGAPPDDAIGRLAAWVHATGTR